MASTKKTLLLETALNLFNEHGFHNTGIDMVQSVSGVSKTTMYKYFKSKDELILEVLRMRHEQFSEWMDGRVAEFAKSYEDKPCGKLRAMFDALHEWIQRDSFCGCNFINACAEFTCCSHPIHQLATEHKLSVQSYVQRLLDDAGIPQSKKLSVQICLLMDGAIVYAHTVGQKEAARIAKEMMIVQLESIACG
ncbi:TetR/AcrR family transcriptional regulator [Litoribrevibacter albus]|nr:TetR family transcriptional regulator [Litoribrevibacter albus]